jgi:hypothetical protein
MEGKKVKPWGVIPHYHQPVLNVYTLGILMTASALILWCRGSNSLAGR